MALIKNYSDASGNSLDQSYWRTVSINIGAYDQKISLVFYGWRDGQAFADGLKPLTGATKKYAITGQEFLAIASAAPTGQSIYDVLAHAAEAYALGKLDTDGKSFFDGATQV